MGTRNQLSQGWWAPIPHHNFQGCFAFYADSRACWWPCCCRRISSHSELCECQVVCSFEFNCKFWGSPSGLSPLVRICGFCNALSSRVACTACSRCASSGHHHGCTCWRYQTRGYLLGRGSCTCFCACWSHSGRRWVNFPFVFDQFCMGFRRYMLWWRSLLCLHQWNTFQTLLGFLHKWTCHWYSQLRTI